MKKLQLFFAAVYLAALSVVPLCASLTHTVDTTGSCWTGTHTIAAADSGMTTANYAVSVYNGAIAPANRVARSLYGASIDTGNYNLSITFSAANWPTNFC